MKDTDSIPEPQDILEAISRHQDVEKPIGLRPTRLTLALVVGLLVEALMLLWVPVF